MAKKSELNAEQRVQLVLRSSPTHGEAGDRLA
jgi:hypothetical protein